MHERIRCQQLEVGIAEYVDDVRPGALHRCFEAHLRGCPGCSEHLQRIRWTIDHLAAFPHEAMPPGMKARLLAAARSGSPARPHHQYFPSSPAS